MEEFFKDFFQYGFSVAVAAFLLLRMEKELRLLRTAIEHLQHCQSCRFSPIVGGDAVNRDDNGNIILPA